MKLKKQLNTIEVFSIAAGAMISSGLFVLPAIAYREAGMGILFSYLFAGILMLPALFTKLELATAIPKAGGTYFFSERILGSAAGVVDGFANWFSISLKSAFALIGIGAFAVLLFPGLTDWHMKFIAAGACVFFTALNLFSVKSSGKVQALLVGFLLLILILFVLLGYRVMDFHSFKEVNKIDWWQTITVTGMVFISYGGLTKIASISEEVKNPQKTLVRGALGAFIVVQILYLLVIFVVLGILPHEELAATYTPISIAAQYLSEDPTNSLIGQIGLIVVSIGAMLAFITTANAGIMAASRVPMAMSRDSLIPSFLSRVSEKRKSPSIAIGLTSVFMLTVIFLLDIKELAKVASLFMLMLFVMVNLSLIVIRFSRLANYKPTFRSPLFPFIQLFGIASYLFLIFQMGLFTMIIASAFIALSLLWFILYTRKRVERKSAFIHMLERLTSPELRGKEEEKGLETELLDILMERNEIVEDRFDEIIRQCSVLDFKKTITRDELFISVSKVISEKWGLDKKEVEEKFKIREEQASTLIYPGVAVPHAIPHVIVPGKNLFDIILVRNKFGIKWNKEGDVVYTAFCLVGSKDERNFHLRALMFIAQILQDPDFHKEWTGARNERELRSVILLTKRKRT
jgi:APA family basic amino acid/polyamine antiporter